MSYFDELRELYANELSMNYLYCPKNFYTFVKISNYFFIQTLSLFSDKKRVSLTAFLSWMKI